MTQMALDGRTADELLVDALHLMCAAEQEKWDLCKLPMETIAAAMSAIERLSEEVRVTRNPALFDTIDAIKAHLETLAGFREQKLWGLRDGKPPANATAAERAFLASVHDACHTLRQAWSIA